MNLAFRHCVCRIVFAAFTTVLATTLSRAAAAPQLPASFAYLRAVDPSIVQDIRYAGADNFVGRPLPGYDAAECILRREAAAALKRVQSDLAAAGLSLKVYDCYRPARASRAMAAWAHDGRSEAGTKRFYPRLQKSSLFALGYIASHSQHSTGLAVDLTIVPAASAQLPSYDPMASYGACTGGAAERSPDNSVDMGTGYDCFDNRSHTATSGITPEQRGWRMRLVEAMRKQGFVNYHREWWHFSYARAAATSGQDFPIRSYQARQ